MKKLIASVCLLASSVGLAQQAPIPAPNDVLGRPFAIRNKWVIGGNGTWDYITLDPAARQLFVTHQSRVQVVDVDSGQVTGQITGLGDARAVVLDPNGQTGYVTDSRSNSVEVFDRRTFERLRRYSLRATPRALVFEPQTGLLFAFGEIDSGDLLLPRDSQAGTRDPRREIPDPCRSRFDQRFSDRVPQSLITVIDPEAHSKVGEMQICGSLPAAVADSDGGVYFAISTTSQVGRLDATALVNDLRGKDKATIERLHASTNADGSLLLDLRPSTQVSYGGIGLSPSLPEFHPFSVGSDCHDLSALAVDNAHNRLFAACANQFFRVVSTDRGRAVASLTIGPGVDAIAFDPSRGLIFTANGGGYGSITVIRQGLNDDYTVVQNLPTMERARTLALDPSSGNLYLVTDLHGAKLNTPPMNGIGTLKLDSIANSFQVLVIGN